MTEEPTSTRQWSQLLVVGCLIGALVLLAGLVPPLTGMGISPADSDDTDFTGPTIGSGDSQQAAVIGAGEEPTAGGDVSHLADVEQGVVHFEAVTSERTYWRLDAYSLYDGGSWEQVESGISSPQFGSSGPGTVQDPIEQTITIRQPAYKLPVAPYPSQFDADEISVHDLEQTPEGGARHLSGVPSGTEYDVMSVSADADPDELRSADPGSISAELTPVWEPHTDEPDDLPDPVHERTQEIIEDEESWYDKALAIESWLQDNYDYSLEATHEPGEDPVEQVLFEMDTIYCQYAATAMAVMLQSEDIPARYTVGYAPGEYVGENTYEVTGLDAHAWVEVFFPGEGWHKFDPTPSEDVPASFGDSEDNDTDDSTYDIQLSDGPAPEPMSEITVGVSKNETPVPNRSVTVIDGVDNQTFQTNEYGRFDYTVPVTDQIEFRVHDGEMDNGSIPWVPLETAETDAQSTGEADGDTSTDGDEIVYRDQRPTGGELQIDSTDGPADEISPLPAGQTVTLTATLDDGTALEGVTVTVNNTTIGQTDSDGEITYPVPEGIEANLTVTGSINGITTTETFPAGPLTIDTSHQFGVALPSTVTGIEVTINDEPVPTGIVSRDGQIVDALDHTGAGTVRLPVENTQTIGVSYGGVEETTEVDSILTNGAIVGGAGFGATVVTAVVVRRYREQQILSGISIRQRTNQLLGGIIAIAEAVGRQLNEAMGSSEQRLSAVIAAFRSHLRQIPSILHGWLKRGNERGRKIVASVGGQQRPPESLAHGAGDDPSKQRIRDAWKRLLGMLDRQEVPTKTPQEIAERAISAGLPAGPVQRLVSIFRAAEYGGATSTDQANKASTAIDELEQHHDQSDPEGNTDD